MRVAVMPTIPYRCVYSGKCGLDVRLMMGTGGYRCDEFDVGSE